MFDNSKPNVILVSDRTDVLTLPKTLGVQKIAHCLRQQGFQVQVIQHLSIFSVTEICDLLKHLISSHTLYIGFSNFFYHHVKNITVSAHGGVNLSAPDPGALLPHGKEYDGLIRDMIKSCNPNCQLVLGGPTVRDVEHNRIYDYMISGYGEMSAVNLAQHLLDPAVPLRKARKSLFGPIVIEDTKAEGYDFQHCDLRYESNDVILPGETLLLEVSRGCIFKCAFCAFPMNGKKKFDYIRHMDLIRDELIDNWQRFGVTRYKFADDTVNDSVEKCEMLANMISGLPFRLEWWGYIRLDLLSAHPKTVDYLFDNGLRGAYFGIETLNAKSASAIGKGGDRRRQIETIHRIRQKYGDSVALHGNFIYGLPYEDMNSMNSTTEWLFSQDNPLDTWHVVPLNIRPRNSGLLTDFVSDLEVNFERYGYREKGTKSMMSDLYGLPRSERGTIIWENDFTDRLEVEALFNEIRQRKAKSTHIKIDGLNAFDYAGLGLDLDSFINRRNIDMDWNQLDRAKVMRAREYKRALYQQIGAATPADIDLWPDTFTEQITSEILIK